MEIQKVMIKCCRWCGRTKIIVLIRVSVISLFHKCLRLLRLGLYTISTVRVDNDFAIVAHICYISLLRCNYYHEYLACEEENFSERCILLKGDWELLFGELFCWKLLSYSLTALERRSHFWSMGPLVSENGLINKKLWQNNFFWLRNENTALVIRLELAILVALKYA